MNIYMLNKESLVEFTKTKQTDIENVMREYCQHLFLSFLYQQPGAEKLLFKGGTALRIVFGSPRFSEDLDFTGAGIVQAQVEELFTDALADVEKANVPVEIAEGKGTTGGYLGIAVFSVHGYKIKIQIEVSLRKTQRLKGVRTLIQNDYMPAYTLVHLPIEDIITGKLEALNARSKPRDFYDYFFLLSGGYPIVKNEKSLTDALKLLRQSKINFRTELRKFLPFSHAMHLKYFSNTLEQKILSYLGNK